MSKEVGELSRAMRKGLKAPDYEEIKGTIDEELWDVIYYAIAVANLYDIDLEQVTAIAIMTPLSNQRLNLPNSTADSCKKHGTRCIVQGERRKQDESDRDWKIYCQAP